MFKTACEKLNCYIDKYYNLNHNSGYLRITIKDKIIFERGFGYADIDNKIEISNKSMFTFYSLSKPFCAIGLLKLKDKGLVDIDSHPSKYLPEAKLFDSRVTIRQILQHISGLPDFIRTAGFDKKYQTGYSYEIRKHLEELSTYPMAFEPGTSAMYANVNFNICALIIENVSGMTYADYMKKEVFDPLGMKCAIVDNENLVIDNRVKGYELIGGKITQAERSKNWMFGAGDIVGTVDDVYCLNKAIKDKLILSSDTWKEVLTPSPLNEKGMGCTITKWNNKYRITHNGGSVGFRTLHIQLPEDDFDIILLSNSGWGDIRKDFADTIYELFYGETSLKDNIEMDTGYI